MTYCFNPSCDRPQNPPQTKFCHHCGSSLLIAQRFRAVRSLQESGASFLVVDQHHPAHPQAVALRLSADQPEEQACIREQVCQLDALSPHPALPKIFALLEWQGAQASALFLIREWRKEVPVEASSRRWAAEDVLVLLAQLLNLRIRLEQADPTLQANHLLGRLRLIQPLDPSAEESSAEESSAEEPSAEEPSADDKRDRETVAMWAGPGDRTEETDLYQIGTLAVQLLPSSAPEAPTGQSPLQILETWEENNSEPFVPELADLLRRLLTAPQFQNAVEILAAVDSLLDRLRGSLSASAASTPKTDGNAIAPSFTAELSPTSITPSSLETVRQACVLENLIAPDFSSDELARETSEPSTPVSSPADPALQSGDLSQVTITTLVITLLADPVQVPLGKLIQKAAQTHPSSEPYPAQTLWEQLIQLQAQGEEAMTLGPLWLELGDFYREQVQKSSRHLVNLVIAIAAYEQALACAPLGFSFPLESYDMLGRLYWYLGRQQAAKRSGCLDTAIQTYQKGLQQLPALEAADSRPGMAPTQDSDEAQLWIELHHHLGEAYSDLAIAEQTPAHGRQAIEAFKAALALESPPARLAMIHNSLGTACWTLAQAESGDESSALYQQAIAAYNAAADQYDPDEEPLRYGMVQNNLGTAYLNLGQHEQSIDILRLAVGTYQVALIYRSRDAAPLSHAATQNNLGAARIQLAVHPYMDPVGAREILEQAIAAYQEALMLVRELQVVGVNRFGFDPDTSQLNLGLAYQRLGMAAPADSSQTFTVHLETAIQSYLDVLQKQPKDSVLYNSALDYLNQSIHYLSDEMGFPADHPALNSLPDHLYVEMSQRLQQQIALEAAL